MKIEHGNAIIGKTLFEINQKMKMNILICAIVRDKNIFIPNGDDIVKEGDVLYITGSPKAINESLEKMNIKVRRISSVLIAGASRIGFYLSKMLEKDGVNVTVVEKVHSKAAELAGNVPEYQLCAVMQWNILRVCLRQTSKIQMLSLHLQIMMNIILLRHAC